MDDFCRWCGTARKQGDRACQACGRTYGGDLKSTGGRTVGVGVVLSVVFVVGVIALAILLFLGALAISPEAERLSGVGLVGLGIERQ
jgi:hypothetical protein